MLALQEWRTVNHLKRGIDIARDQLMIGCSTKDVLAVRTAVETIEYYSTAMSDVFAGKLRATVERYQREDQHGAGESVAD